MKKTIKPFQKKIFFSLLSYKFKPLKFGWLSLLGIFSGLSAQTPCNQRVIENIDFNYNSPGTAPARWDMSQINAGGFSLDQTAYSYLATGNFSNQNLNSSGAGTNNATRQYAIVKNPNNLNTQYGNIPTDGMIVLNPVQNQSDQYFQYAIAGLIPGNTYTFEIKVWNVIDLAMPGTCGQWCNWNDQVLVDWAGNGNNAHDGLGTMDWTGTNGSGNWNGYGNQINDMMKISSGGSYAIMKAQVTLADATTGFTITFKKGNSINPIVLGVDYIKVYGCQAEAINVSGGSNSVCEATDITLTAQGIGSPGSVYSWYQNGVLLPGRIFDTLNIISSIGIGTAVNYKAVGEWNNKSVILTSKLCCSSVGGISDEVIKQSFDGLTYSCTGGRSGGYADIPEKNINNFIDPVYIYSGTTCDGLNDGHYAVVQSSYAGDYWRNRPEVKDHTGIPGSGALFINATGGLGQIFYKFNLTGLCASTRYEFSVWYASLATGSEIKPSIEFDVINGATNIASTTTGLIPVNEHWYQANVTFMTPSTGTPTYTLQAVNLISGTNGNDLMLDDIVVKKCTPNISLYQDGTKDTTLSICNTNPVLLKISTYYDLPLAITGSSSGTVYFQWMKATSPAGPWTLIGVPENTGAYLATPTAVTTYYRAKVSANYTRASTGLPPLASECGNDGMSSSFSLILGGSFSIPPVSGTTAYCEGSTITLNGDNGTGAQWGWKKGLTYASAAILPGYALSSDITKKSFIKTAITTADAGNYYFFVQNASGCEAVSSIIVTVNSTPTATISGTTNVCQNAGTAPNITFTGAGGTAPYTFTYNINGGPNLTVTTVSGNTVIVAAPTTATGLFAYNLTGVKEASASVCSGVVSGQTASITVNTLPTAAVSGTITVQLNATAPNITFTGGNGTPPYTFTYNINGGNSLTATTTSGNTVTVAASTAVNGIFAYNLVSVKDAGAATCSATATGTATITVNDLPTATITGAALVCKNSTPAPNVTFTGGNGSAPYTFTYNINGGADLTVTTTSGNNVALAAPTVITGIFIYTVTKVQTTVATNTITGQSITVTVSPLPSATISGTTAVCQNTATAADITFTGAGGTAPYTFTYNINGGVTLTATTVSGNTVTVAAPTSSTGSFIYNLIGVKDAGTATCSSIITGQATTITINPLPAATVGGTTSVCQNAAPATTITFTGSGGTAPYTFTYNINGGAALTATTVSGNAVSLAVPTAESGSFAYNLTGVKDNGSSSCSSVITGQAATITVSPLPVASISGNTAICQNATPAPDITFTAAGGTAPYTFTYNINGGTPLTVTTTSGNTVSVAAPTAATGSFIYNLVSVKAAGAVTCSNVITGQAATVAVTPAPAVVSASVTLQPDCINTKGAIKITAPSGAFIQYSIDGTAYQSSGSFTGLKPGTTYSITAKNTVTGCVSAAKTIVVNAIPAGPVTATASVTQQPTCITPTGTITVTAPSGTNIQYSLDGVLYQTNKTFTRLNPSSGYPVTSKDILTGCISSSQLITIGSLPANPIVSAGPDKDLISGQTVVLDGQASGSNFTFTWSPTTNMTDASSLTPTVSPQSDQIYILTVTSQYGCASTDEVKVSVLKEIIIPNAFSPNSDNINDKWVISNIEGYPLCTVSIFNRYGQPVFESKGYSLPWDGTYKGNPLPVGAYYWIIKLKPGKKPLSGSISIIR